MRLLVCGGRYFNDGSLLFNVLDRIHNQTPISLLISGAQRTKSRDGKFVGADWLAIEWALHRQIDFCGMPARWKTEGNRAAGPKRNARMLEKARPELFVAFPGGDGTADMTRRALAAGVPQYQIPELGLTRSANA